MRLSIREICRDDEDNLFELDSDPEVMRFLTNGVPSTREYILSALDRTEKLLQKHNGHFGFWAAIEKQSGNFMGWFLFRPCKKDPENVTRIELGYRLKKAYWGKGFATEGSRSLIEKGFREFAIDEIFAVTMQTNLASQEVMKKCGLTFVRDFYNEEFPGTQVKDVEYSISKELWRRQKQRNR